MTALAPTPEQALVQPTTAEALATLRALFVPEHPLWPAPSDEKILGTLRQIEGRTKLRDLIEHRAAAVRRMVEDPLHHGYEWRWYQDARGLLTKYDELVVMGGTDSGKSWFGAKWGVEQLQTDDNKGINFAFCHSTQDSSKDQQQKLIHNHLPPHWRGRKPAKDFDVSFKPKSSFTDDKFVAGNKHVFFFFYAQDIARLTGYKLDGAWCDELITIRFLIELRRRMLGRNGKILITFTPVDGYTDTVADYLDGAELVESRPSQYLPGQNLAHQFPEMPKGHMPYILKCARSNAAVICCFSEWSPFRAPEELFKGHVEGKLPEYIMATLYGWPVKGSRPALPKFGDAHIIRRNPEALHVPGPVPPCPWKERNFEAGNTAGAEVTEPQTAKGLAAGISGNEPLMQNHSGPSLPPERRNTAPALYPRLGQVGTNYCVMDPGGAKNPFIKWYRVVPRGGDSFFVMLYREWPDWDTHGEWSRPAPQGKYDGVPGPAQRSSFGAGYVPLKQLILRLEGWVWDEASKRWDGTNAEEIREDLGCRIIDARAGGTEVPSEEEQQSHITNYAEEHRDQAGHVVGPSMLWTPSDSKHGSIAEQQGIMMLNDWFDYDQDLARREGGLKPHNCPTFYVVEDCRQSIYAYRTYTGLGGAKGATKDIMDPDWYLRKAGVMHLDVKKFRVKRGGSY